MMSLGDSSTATRRGHFGVAVADSSGGSASTSKAIRSPRGLGRPRTGESESRRLVDVEELPEEHREAIDAEEYIVYGKASVEQYDDDSPSQKLTMKALEEALPQLYDTGIISRRHKDVPVGEVVKSYTLDEPTSIRVGDETLSFTSGDTLETHVEDDEFWVVGKLYGNTEIAKDTRHKAATGELDGFSVTIYAKDVTHTKSGEQVDALDWHSITIGRDDQIKNPDARFGVAEYKAFFGAPGPGTDDSPSPLSPTLRDDLAASVSSKLDEAMPSQSSPDDSLGLSLKEELTTMTNSTQFWSQIFEKAGEEIGLSEEELDKIKDSEDAHEDLGGKQNGKHNKHSEDASGTPDHKADDENGDGDGDGDGNGDGDGEPAPEQKQGNATQEALMILEQEYGPEARAKVEEVINTTGGMGPPPEDQPPAEEEPIPPEQKAGDDVVTQEELDKRLSNMESKMATSDDIESLREETKAAVTDAVPDAVEGVAEKMATGQTPSATVGGSAAAEDYHESIQNTFARNGGGEGE